MIAADLARAGILAVLTVLTLTGHATIAVLAVAVLLLGAGRCFFNASSQGLVPMLVGRDKDDLAHVNGRYTALGDAGALAGPALGSFAFAAHRALPFAADAISFLASAALVRKLPDVPREPRPATSVTTDVREGLRFVWGHRQLRSLVVVMCVNNSAYSIAMATFVLFATQVMHIPPAGYGVMFAVAAVGGVLAGWWNATLTTGLSHRSVLAVACLTQGAAWAAIAVTANPWIAATMLFFSSATVTLGGVAIMSARAQVTPDRLLGRATSVFRITGVGIGAFAALAGGALGSWLGLHAPLYTAAAILLVLGAAVTARPFGLNAVA